MTNKVAITNVSCGPMRPLATTRAEFTQKEDNHANR
jgi:hypothetical protein